jgi:hypothetical protein
MENTPINYFDENEYFYIPGFTGFRVNAEYNMRI